MLLMLMEILCVVVVVFLVVVIVFVAFYVSYDVQRKEVVGMSSCCPKRQTQWLMISLL